MVFKKRSVLSFDLYWRTSTLKWVYFSAVSCLNFAKFPPGRFQNLFIKLLVMIDCVVDIIQFCDLLHFSYRKCSILTSTSLIHFSSELLNSKHCKRIIKFFGVFPFIRAYFLVFLLLIIAASRISFHVLFIIFEPCHLPKF